MRKTLNIFEKIALCFHALIDARSGSISLISQSEIVLSAYIADELAKMFISSKNVFLRRYTILFLGNKRIKNKYCIRSFFNAITLIDRHISETYHDIAKLEAPYNAQKDKMALLKEGAEVKKAVHLVRMYDIKMIELETEKISAVDNKYKKIEHLLNEKIRILKKALVYQDKIQANCFLRLQYYYDKACCFNKEHQIISLNMSKYYDVIDMSFLEQYVEQLADAKKQLEDIADRTKQYEMLKEN